MTLADLILPISYEEASQYAMVFTDQLAGRLAELHAEHTTQYRPPWTRWAVTATTRCPLPTFPPSLISVSDPDRPFRVPDLLTALHQPTVEKFPMCAMSPRLLRPRASGFNPKSIAGLQAWYDAADATTLGPTSNGVGSVSNNGPVKFVKDKSSGGFDLTQTGADSAAPTYVTASQNGLPALSFDGGDQVNRSGSGAIMTEPFTLFIACKANATGTVRVCGVAGTRSIGPFAVSNTEWGFFQTNASGNISTFGVSATAASVLAVSSTSGRAGTFFGNGTQAGTATIANITVGGFALGADVAGGGSRINGLIYECLSYDSALSASQIASITRYLGRKWGITVA